MNRQEQFDRLLDAALRDYTSAEPRPGLEQRVIANLRAAPATARFGWLRWAAAAAACALVAMALLQLRHPETPAPVTALHTPPPPAITAPQHAPVASPGVRAMTPRQRLARAPKPEKPAPAPKQPPLAGPLSPQERALVALVQQAPKLASQLAAQEREPAAPLAIHQVEVPPVAVAVLEVAPLEK